MADSTFPSSTSAFAIHDFVDKQVETVFRAHSAWSKSSEQEFEFIGEVLERFLMTKLWPKTFEANAEHVEKNFRIVKKIKDLESITPAALDIAPIYCEQFGEELLLAQNGIMPKTIFLYSRAETDC